MHNLILIYAAVFIAPIEMIKTGGIYAAVIIISIIGTAATILLGIYRRKNIE